MFGYSTPGAYFEWQDVSPPQPAIKRTDIAGFVGIASRGPLYQPVKIQSWTQFVSVFGGYIQQAYLAYAVEGFFANGGRTCWVVRVANTEGSVEQQAKPGSLVLYDDGDGINPVTQKETIKLVAVTPGTWSKRLVVSVLRTSETRFNLVFRMPDGGQEVWPNLSMKKKDPRYICKVINQPGFQCNLGFNPDLPNDQPETGLIARQQQTGSQWIRVELFENDGEASTRPPNEKGKNLQAGTARLKGGQDGLTNLAPSHFEHGLSYLEKVDEVSVVAIPDIMPVSHIPPSYKPPVPPDCTSLVDVPITPGDGLPVQDQEPVEYPPVFDDTQIKYLQDKLILHCELLKDRVAIIDLQMDNTTPGLSVNDPEKVIALREPFSSSYAAVYYPWISVPDPLSLTGLIRSIPPSGHIAGLYARIDNERGVHKPPANHALVNVEAAVVDINDVMHGVFNENHINVIRKYNGRGIRVSGARTLSIDPDYKYINVRRLLTMISEVIDEKSQTFVFEPNNHDLWRQIERMVRNFLDLLWREGMLDGASAEQAYSVRCDAETNPQNELDNGRVICEIGLYLPWPAEFVVVRIGFTDSGASLLEGVA